MWRLLAKPTALRRCPPPPSTTTLHNLTSDPPLLLHSPSSSVSSLLHSSSASPSSSSSSSLLHSFSSSSSSSLLHFPSYSSSSFSTYRKRDRSHLKRHELRLAEPIFKCQEEGCGRTFRSPNRLEAHYLSSHWQELGKIPFTCKCKARFSSNTELKQHKSDCPLKNFRSFNHYLQVLKDKHNKKVDKYAEKKEREIEEKKEEEDKAEKEKLIEEKEEEEDKAEKEKLIEEKEEEEDKAGKGFKE